MTRSQLTIKPVVVRSGDGDEQGDDDDDLKSRP